MPALIPDILIINAEQLLTVRSSNGGPKTKESMNDLNILKNGAVAIKDGKIIDIGTPLDLSLRLQLGDSNYEFIDASHKVVMPGFVDAHTHPVFGGSREDEFEMRIAGTSYQAIASAGGGINSTVKKTRAASKDELLNSAKKRLDNMLLHGTTTIEAKSGYGLSTESEIKMLEILAKLNEEHPIDIVPTFLGAHEVPEEYKDNKKGYIKVLKEEMIPAVAKKKLAVFCDVFCEKGVFSVEESREILLSAQKAGIGRIKIHADELSAYGGAELSAELKAVSADHLCYVSDYGIQRLKEEEVSAVLLPGTTFFLKQTKYAPARKMIDEGVIVALATDCNPGSCMTENMQFIITLACIYLGMTPAEAITSATINAAYAICKEKEVGSIEIGKQADIIILDVPNYKHIPYHFGVNHVDTVIKKGKTVVRNGQLVETKVK